MARKRDVVTQALRRLNVTGHNQAPAQGQYALALEHLEQVFADLNGPWGGLTLSFTIDEEIPTVYAFPLGELLAARLAPVFKRPAPMSEVAALFRVRAVAAPYVRDMDLDEDGTTDDDEVEAVDRSAYY